LGLKHMCQITGQGSVKVGSEDEAGGDGFKYMLSMKMWSLTECKVEALRKLHGERSAALDELKGTSLHQLWERDLQRLEAALDVCDAEDRKEAEAAAKLAAKHIDQDAVDLVNKQCVLVLDRNLRAKRVRTSEWKARRRGAAVSGRKGLTSNKVKKGKAEEGKEDVADGEAAEEGEDENEAEGQDTEALAGVFCCHDFDALLVFSEHGHVYMLQALDVPLAKKMSAPGTELKEFLPELEGHRIAALVTVDQGALRDQTNDFVVLVSKNGFAKKVSIDRYKGLKPGKGVPAFKLEPGDELRWAHKASANSALAVVTAQGFLLRCSLGEDWRLSTAKGPGRIVMKMKTSQDAIASCSVSDLTEKELAQIRAKAAAKAAAAAAKAHAATEGAGKGEEDDDEEMEAPAEESEAEEENEKENEEDDEEAGDRPAAEAENGAEGIKAEGEAEAEEASPQVDVGQCVFLVTENGWGNRVPVSCKRIGLSRKGGKGKRVMKIQEGRDRIVAACVVSGKPEVQQPLPSKHAWQLYVNDQKDAQKESQDQEETPEDGPSAGAAAEEEKGFAKIAALKAKFSALPEEEQLPYHEMADELKLKYDEEVEAYRRQDVEEVLLGTTAGQVSRITVGSVPVTTRANRGKIVARVKGSKICTVSLLSSMDDDPEDEGKDGAKSTPPAASKVVSSSAKRLAAIRARQARLKAGRDDEGEPAPSTPKGQDTEAPEVGSAQRPPPLDLTSSKRSSLASARLGKARLSHLVSPAANRHRVQGSPRVLQSHILKPKLRILKNPFMTERPNLMVSVFDVGAAARRAGVKK